MLLSGLIEDYVRTASEQYWELTLEVIDQAPSRIGLARFAAGPLENLIKNHGPEVIGKVRLEAQQSKRFLYALGNVWLNKQDDVFNEFVSILSDNGVTSAGDLEKLQLL